METQKPQLTVFAFESAALRTIDRDGEPWFVAKDVCSVLEIDNVSQALARLDEDERNTLILNEGTSPAGGNPNVNIINESGLYSLVLGSRKPEAKKFKKWVTSEVLPAIRKTGSYSAPSAPETNDVISALVRQNETVIKIVEQLAARQLPAIKERVAGDLTVWEFFAGCDALDWPREKIELTRHFALLRAKRYDQVASYVASALGSEPAFPLCYWEMISGEAALWAMKVLAGKADKNAPIL